jgi:hypothetical protein
MYRISPAGVPEQVDARPGRQVLQLAIQILVHGAALLVNPPTCLPSRRPALSLTAAGVAGPEPSDLGQPQRRPHREVDAPKSASTTPPVRTDGARQEQAAPPRPPRPHAAAARSIRSRTAMGGRTSPAAGAAPGAAATTRATPPRPDPSGQTRGAQRRASHLKFRPTSMRSRPSAAASEHPDRGELGRRPRVLQGEVGGGEEARARRGDEPHAVADQDGVGPDRIDRREVAALEEGGDQVVADDDVPDGRRDHQERDLTQPPPPPGSAAPPAPGPAAGTAPAARPRPPTCRTGSRAARTAVWA